MFGKYEICRVLGRGASGTVYLAKHMKLDEYRAIKEVPRSIADYQQFRKEALILKSLRHPSIPIVYDLEETADHFYMVEEWIDGISLYRMVSDLGHLSVDTALSYGIQICRLVSFLHSAKPNPILYLDLHPRNLIVCGSTVKLVDFDHSVHIDEAECMEKRYGTIGFAAPEQYTGGKLNESTDIYAIGAVLHYMVTGSCPDRHFTCSGEKTGRRLSGVIRKCLRQEPRRRFCSAAELGNSLERIQKSLRKHGRYNDEYEASESLRIAVAGAGPGTGTTHIAIGLAAWLCRQGKSVLYEECNPSGAVQHYADFMGIPFDAAGVCRIRGIPMRPNYGAAVKLEPAEYPVRVCDCGTVGDVFLQKAADGYLLVCGSKPWEWKESRRALALVKPLSDLGIVYNQFSDRKTCCIPAPERKIPCFLMPYVPDPWETAVSAETVYQALWRLWTANR